MRIGIDASATAKENKTGIDNTAYQIILNLQKFDSKNEYILYTNAILPKELTKNPNFHEKLIPLKRLWHKFRLPLALLRDKPDAFLELTNPLPAFAPEKSYILLHDFAFKYFPEAYTKVNLIEQEDSVKNAIVRAKKIFVTSKANKEDLKRHYSVRDDQIEIANLGYDKNTFKKISNSKNPFGFSEPFFLFVGRLEKRKNVSNIVRAFDNYKDIYKTNAKLVLAGFKANGYDEIEELIKQSKYSKEIIEPGYISNEDMVSLLNLAIALVYPSLYEGFGLPILEAFACETPVITSNVSTLKEVASDAAIIVEATDIKNIAEQMNIISTDMKFRESLIQKGISQLEKYDWQKTAKKYYEVITQ